MKAALAHPKCAGLSDNQIAKHVGVAQSTVSGWRAKLSPDPTYRFDKSTTRTGADGRTINVANIGRKAEQPSRIYKIS